MIDIAKYKETYIGAYNEGASEEEVDLILRKYGVTDQDYKEWLIHINGGPIGSDWYDSINELTESQEKLKREWSILGFSIGWDGAGNPIVMQPDGTIVTEDHNFGGIHKIANNFKALLTNAVSS
jgi:hypothetical protein